MYVLSYAPFGADGIIIRVEADIRRGIPGVDITGLAEGAVREARERVRAGFRNSGFVFPPDRILINLAPAGVKKAGAALDLPIALAVMIAAGIVPAQEGLMVMGEMELSGAIRPVLGVLAATAAGLKAGIKDFIVPAGNAREAEILAAGRVAAVSSLAEAVEAIMTRFSTGKMPCPAREMGENAYAFSLGDCSAERCNLHAGDFAEVRGQDRYKRALELAAAGGHNLLVFGPPGAGKTLLARRLPSIMPALSPEEAVEVTRIHSLAGQLSAGEGGGGLIRFPPFRAPHHSASAEGILGGGRAVRPGEISLAHFGALFLDEAPEFRSTVLQALREPLEDRVVTIVRAEGPVKLPADFQLILAANGCPCGRLGVKAKPGEDRTLTCFCSPEEIRRYWRKFGGALMDRVELRAAVGNPELDASPGAEESSEAIARRVEKAVEIQRERFRRCKASRPGSVDVRRNARIPPGLVEECCPLSDRGKRAFQEALVRMGLSGRAYHGCLKLARTIADLEGAETIDAVHILEAVEYRRLGEDPYDLLTAG